MTTTVTRADLGDHFDVGETWYVEPAAATTITDWDVRIKKFNLDIKWPEHLRSIARKKEADIPTLERRLAELEEETGYQVIDDPASLNGYTTIDKRDYLAWQKADLKRQIAKAQMVVECCKTETEIRNRMAIQPKTPEEYAKGDPLVIEAKDEKFTDSDRDWETTIWALAI